MLEFSISSGSKYFSSKKKSKKLDGRLLKKNKNKCFGVPKWQSVKPHDSFRANKTNQGLSEDLNGRDPPGALSPTQPAQNQLWSATRAFVVGNVSSGIKAPHFPWDVPQIPISPAAAAGPHSSHQGNN